MSVMKTAAGDISPAVSRSDPPIYQVSLWPHRSMSRRGFRIVMSGSGAMLAVPMIPLIGTKVALALAPFLVGAWLLLWLLIRRNYRDGRLQETLRLWPDLIWVERREPKGLVRNWSANPYWVELEIHPNARPENYVTLRGSGRTIELGAFLSPEEREVLYTELDEALALARTDPDSAPWRGPADAG
jgi:uncharacterized membrane protein